MLQIIGIVVLFACVFGGFLISGGKLDSVIEAAPHEMLTIGGAALAALLIASSMYTLKKIGGDFSKIISGPKWKAADFHDLLCLLFLLTKTMKSKGLIALEAHIEKPEDSSIFKRYPKIMKDHFADDDHEPGRPAASGSGDGKTA
jgi:chemotaxis protein MotA